jgi:cell division protein YceG involved in septum cleavage
MTVPVHSVKHIKAEYHRYQLMAIVSVIITIVAIILSAVTSFQVAHLGKQRAEAQSAFQIRADEMLQRETITLKERIVEMEQQLVTEKTLVQQLNSRITALQKRLNEVKSVGKETVGSELQSPDQIIKAVPVTADDASQPD